jgi:hypothetical protein
MPKRDELKEPTRWVTASSSRAPRCSQQTLRNWSDKGILSIRKTPGGRFHYSIPVGKQDDSVKENVIYARVSSAKQADLVRQVDFLRHRFPNHKVVTDVGSGVNFKRKGFSLLTPAAQPCRRNRGCPSRQARQNWLRLLEHVFLRQDQFSLSSKIMLATDVQKNSTKTSWRCLPISQPNTTESVLCQSKSG